MSTNIESDTLEKQQLLQTESPTPEDWLSRRFTPTVVLVTLSLIHCLNYGDRGAIAGCLINIRSDHKISAPENVLSVTKAGIVASSFLLTYLPTAPLFVALGGRLSTKQIFIIGLTVWSIATFCECIAQSYLWILLARCFTGTAEAAYFGFAMTLIDQIAPRERRVLWIGVFSAMIPAGMAVGMAFGGVVGENVTLWHMPGWRIVFGIEVLAMLPLIFLVALMPAKYNVVKSAKRSGDKIGQSPDHDDFISAIRHLISNGNYLLAVFGNVCNSLVMGSIGVYVISMLEEGPMRVSPNLASTLMGAFFGIAGLVGAFVGGYIADQIVTRSANRQLGFSRSVFFMCAGVIMMLCIGIPTFLSERFWLFLPGFFISCTCDFGITAPANAAPMTVVSEKLRAYANTFYYLILHLFGDVPSLIYTGAIADAFGEKCRHLAPETNCTAMKNCVWMPKRNLQNPFCVNEYALRNALMIVTAVLFLTIVTWATLAFRVRRAVKIDASDEKYTDINN